MPFGDSRPDSPDTLRARVARYLASPGSTYITIALAILACWQIFEVGTATDDWLHQLYLADAAQIEGLEPRPWDLFTFANGNPASNHALVDAGIFPWWTDPHAKLAFFRPLSVLLARIDDWCWADYPVMMHVHSLVWFALALAAVSLAYRRWLRDTIPVSGPAIAGLALWLFALDDARGPTVGWIANRNALVSLALSSTALWLHARAHHSDARRWDSVLALVAWGFALASGESALGALGYLVGFSLWLQPGSLRERLTSLLPYLLLAGAFLWIRASLGYGTFGSDFYLDPLHDTLGYLSQAWNRIPALLASLLAGIWSDIPAGLGVVLPQTQVYLALGCTLAFSGVIYFGWPAWKDSPAAKALALGLLGNTVLCAATFPADRILSLCGFGASGLLAIAIWEYTGAQGPFFSRRAVAWGLFLVHGIAAPALLPARSLSMQVAVRPFQRVTQSLPSEDALQDHTLILINPPSDPQASFFQIYRLAHGEACPARFRWLSTGTTELSITRLDAYTLRLVQSGGFLPNMSERMLRSIHRPFAVGEEIELTGLRVTVEALTKDGRPAQVRFRFRRPLEDPHFLWAKWDGDRFVPYRPPRVGAPDKLPAYPLIDELQATTSPLPAPLSIDAWQAQARSS